MVDCSMMSGAMIEDRKFEVFEVLTDDVTHKIQSHCSVPEEPGTIFLKMNVGNQVGWTQALMIYHYLLQTVYFPLSKSVLA